MNIICRGRSELTCQDVCMYTQAASSPNWDVANECPHQLNSKNSGLCHSQTAIQAPIEVKRAGETLLIGSNNMQWYCRATYFWHLICLLCRQRCKIKPTYPISSCHHCGFLLPIFASYIWQIYFLPRVPLVVIVIFGPAPPICVERCSSGLGGT